MPGDREGDEDMDHRTRLAAAEAVRDGALVIAAEAISVMTDDQRTELRNRLERLQAGEEL